MVIIGESESSSSSFSARLTTADAVGFANDAAPEVGAPETLASRELLTALEDLARLAWLGVPGCDGASLSLLSSGEATTLAASHDHVRALDVVQYAAGQGPCVSAMREEHVVRVPDFATETRWPQVDSAFRSAGIRSSLSIPLSEGAGSLGGLNMYAFQPKAFTDDSERAAHTFGRQAVMLLGYLQQMHTERAAHAREHDIASALQRSLLPRLPHIAGITSAARYLVSGNPAQVGGDWYDLFALPDGAIGVAIGDVMGHDVQAAAAMGQLRSVVRSYAWEGTAPALVLDRLDRLVQGFDMAEIATAIYGRLVLEEDTATFRFANAGHLPPLLRRADGWVERVDGPGSPLIGAQPDGSDPRSESTVTLEPGSLLVLYTDGLIETRDSDIDERIDLLSKALARLPLDSTAEQVCQHLIEAFASDGPRDDDIALLVIALDEPGASAADVALPGTA